MRIAGVIALKRAPRCKTLSLIGCQVRLPISDAVNVRWHSANLSAAPVDRRNDETDETDTRGRSGSAPDPQSSSEWAGLLAAAESTNTEANMHRTSFHAASIVTAPPRMRSSKLAESVAGEPQSPPPSRPHAELAIPPEGEPLPAGLPTGFRDMSPTEQEEELWILLEGERLETEWKTEILGKHRPYMKDFPRYSPVRVVGTLLRWRNRRWTPREWQLARAIANNRSLRPSIITAQALLRRYALLARRTGITTKIERYLGRTWEWKKRLRQLQAQTGITEGDIKQWLWILNPMDGDMQVTRFLKSDCRKPFFLLMALLARDRIIRKPATFIAYIKYIRDNYISSERPADELANPAYQGQGRSMTWWHFLVLLHRLVRHARETWPAGMPLISRLAADYIATMPPDQDSRALTGPQARSLVFNKALQHVGWPARIRPLDHIEHNWAAQRQLLQLAASVEPPLMMDKNSYRSVRTVLLGMSKTKDEARNVDRAVKTWPPYRRALDGIDERRNPEDGLSRSVKAGLLAREAGYNDDSVDRALSALGGSTFGDSPTIQTRSLPPPMFSGNRANLNVYTEWASTIRATRNAREAWFMFEHPPQPGLRPDIHVYTEMFQKLFARPVADSSGIRPGDVKEVFPVHDGNLSEFEIARLTPPKPEELYELMLHRDHIRPTGHCLAVLVANAPSKEHALRFLDDSPWRSHIGALKDFSLWTTKPRSGEPMRELSMVPIAIFHAWIAMLCRIHTLRPKQEGPADTSISRAKQRAMNIAGGATIVEAIELTRAFHARNGKLASRDKRSWHLIMEALAGPKLLYSFLGAPYNVLKTLTWFLHVYEKTIASKSIDIVSFESLCVMIRKALKLSTFEDDSKSEKVQRDRREINWHLGKFVVHAHRLAVAGFQQLTLLPPVGQGIAEEWEEWDDETPHGVTQYNVSGRPLYRYMMALGCCGSGREMVRLMDWILDGWDGAHIRDEAKDPKCLPYQYLIRAFAYFVDVAKNLVEPAEMERLRQRLDQLVRTRECTWFWPDESWREQAGATADAEADLQIVTVWQHVLRDNQVSSMPMDGSMDSGESLSELIDKIPGVLERERPPGC